MRCKDKPILFLCPAGLSLLGNLKNKELYTSGDVKQCIKVFFREADDSKLMEMSAEINSLFRMGLERGDKVLFLSSDTDECETISHAIAGEIEKRRGCEAAVKRIKGLQTADKRKFEQTGITELTEAILNEVENNRWQYDIVLNATAGFKAVVPYITFIGMIFNFRIMYIFELSESLIELPPIPVDFDVKRLERLEPVIDDIMGDYISREDFQNKTGLSYNEMRDYTGDILIEEDGLLTLRPTGRILYKRYLQRKGYKIYISEMVQKKLESGRYDKNKFVNLFKKMRDPIHLDSKRHPEIKDKGRIELECYKEGSTSERIFYYIDNKAVKICDIFMHDEYERALENRDISLCRSDFKNTQFGEFLDDMY